MYKHTKVENQRECIESLNLYIQILRNVLCSKADRPIEWQEAAPLKSVLLINLHRQDTHLPEKSTSKILGHHCFW